MVPFAVILVFLHDSLLLVEPRGPSCSFCDPIRSREMQPCPSVRSRTRNALRCSRLCFLAAFMPTWRVSDFAASSSEESFPAPRYGRPPGVPVGYHTSSHSQLVETFICGVTGIQLPGVKPNGVCTGVALMYGLSQWGMISRHGLVLRCSGASS